MQAFHCPSADDLTAFLLGEFPENREQLLCQHLESCTDCEERMRQLDQNEDAFIRAIRLGSAAEAGRLRADTISMAGESQPAGAAQKSSGRPTCLAGYTLLEEIGRGGMGVVYKARQARLGRLVALKMILHGDHAGPTERSRFRREAQAIARLRHPNFVQVYEVGEADNQPFFSLEYCAGGNLAEKLAGAPLPPRDAAQLVQILALAMQAAHEQGVIHRDLKPSNVLLSEADVPKITDFGLAKNLDDRGQTASGAILGTPSYMAPEQAGGKTRELGPACDIYALGAILYECLTGRPPFMAATPLDTLLQVVNDEPVAVRQLQSKTPRDLETICLKCLQKDPRKRYASAQALADDLRRFLAHEPIAARPIAPLARGWRWCRRNPAWAAMTLALAALLAVLAVGGGLAYWQLQQAFSESETRRLAAVHAEQQRKVQLFEALLAAAHAKRFSQRAGQRFEALDAIRKATRLARELDRPAETFDELRNLAIGALALPDYRCAPNRDIAPEGTHALVFDDRAELFGRGDQSGLVTVRRLMDDRELASWQGKSPVTLAFAHDGAAPFLFLLGSDGILRRWQLTREGHSQGEPVPIGPCSARTLGGLMTADATRLVLWERGVFRVYDLTSGKQRHEIRLEKWLGGTGAVPIHYCAMHPFAHLLAASFGDPPNRRTAGVIDLDDGSLRELRHEPAAGQTFNVSWHPDGRTLAVGYTQSVAFWDVPTGRIVQKLSEHKGGALFPYINRTGELLYTISAWTGSCKLWHPQTHRPLLNLTGIGLANESWRYCADGRLVYISPTGSPGRRVEILEPAREFRTLVRAPFRGEAVREYRHGSVHRDGRLLAVGTTQGVSLFDLATGVDVGHLDLGHNWGVHFIAQTGELLTYGQRGLLRWPVQTDQTPHRLRLGPPVRVPVERTSSDNLADASRDGSVIAAAQYQRAVVVHRDRPGKLIRLEPLQECRQQISVSPDGRWVATGLHFPVQGNLNIWDAHTGKLVKTLQHGPGSNPCFSPDGKWLAAVCFIGGDRTLWQTGTWQLHRKVRGPTMSYAAFSPDSRLLAGERSDGKILLEETITGKQVATLENPYQAASPFVGFSPDGTLLITINADMIHVWDLRKIRAGLAELGLDWDAPPYPPEPIELRRAGTLRPLEVQVSGSEETLKPGK